MTTPGLTIRWISELLDSLGIAHMVVGSFASSAHGVPRTTNDVDVVFDPGADDLARLLAAIDRDRFYVDDDTARDALRRRGMFNVIDATTGWKIDLVITELDLAAFWARAQALAGGAQAPQP